MDFGLLTIPLVTLAMAFGFAVFTDTQTIHFDYVDVPDSISQETGLTPAVVITKLADDMQEIERQAFTKAEARQVELHADQSATSVLGEYLGVTPLIRVVQESAHMIPFTFSGEIVRHDQQVEFILRSYDSHHNKTRISRNGSVDDMKGLIHGAAYEAMRVVNPYILAAYQFKRDRLSRDFTPTLEILRRELEGHDSRYAPWLHNLWGMVLYQQNDRHGAIHQFEEAVHLDPNFLSPRLNLGVVNARLGEYDSAVRNFTAVVQHPNVVQSPAVKAAALSEWGFTLALTGRIDEAYAKFDEASRTDTNFSDVYSSWAEVLSAQGRREEAERMTAKALKLAPKEVVYTENLIGTVQNVPATASMN
ncbi:hypothetical protein CRT60_19945 [Azospirillum palustre]|uniref:Uncharacterized protein n=1 Tax=Azospirillum palustre TaxID=2044885 RepID=A0A2B8BDE3_9PROT|nr:tetratricopeptide repeat protein [Azospirillum palustre]PGH55563.1 hypothetical protein CRT60_19945 [Azospirillum palustre]